MRTSIHPTRFPLNEPDRSSYLYVSIQHPPSQSHRAVVAFEIHAPVDGPGRWTRKLESIASSIPPLLLNQKPGCSVSIEGTEYQESEVSWLGF